MDIKQFRTEHIRTAVIVWHIKWRYGIRFGLRGDTGVSIVTGAPNLRTLPTVFR